MVFLFFYRYFFGWLRLQAYGDFPERIINICAKNFITIWSIKNKSGQIFFSIDIKSFRKLVKVRKESGIKLKIHKKAGLPFLLNKYRKRTGLIVGLVFFLLIIKIMSLFVWNVVVTGNQRVFPEMITEACQTIGIKQGIFAKDVNTADMRNELLMLMPQLSWVAFNIEGCKLTVEVQEVSENKAQDKNPCNIVASEDGIIREIEVKSGQIVVKVGDAVKKGDLLVSGTVELAGGVTAFRMSEGSVVAEIEKIITVERLYEFTEKVKTGNFVTKNLINFFGLKIPLYVGGVKGEYEKQMKVYRPQAGTSYVPIEMISANFYEIKTVTRTLSKEEALEKAQHEVDIQLKDDVIISASENMIETKDGIKLTVSIKALQEIGVKDKLEIDNSK